MTSRELTLAVWSLIGLAVVVCAGISAARPASLPTPLTAFDALVASVAGRVLVLVGWMWLGWHLFAR